MSNNTASLSIAVLESDYLASRMEAELNGIKGRDESAYHDRMLSHIETLRSIAEEAQQQAQQQTLQGEVVGGE